MPEAIGFRGETAMKRTIKKLRDFTLAEKLRWIILAIVFCSVLHLTLTQINAQKYLVIICMWVWFNFIEIAALWIYAPLLAERRQNETTVKIVNSK